MFTVSDLPRLNALFRALLEAKFHEHPSDLDVPASPFVAEMIAEVRDCLRALELERDGSAAEKRWTAWLSIDSSRREWRIAQGFAVEAWRRSWSSWTEDARGQAIGQLLSPFDVTSELIKTFSKELEEAWK